LEAVRFNDSSRVRIYFETTNETSITGKLYCLTKLTIFSWRNSNLSSTGESGSGILVFSSKDITDNLPLGEINRPRVISHR